jgi:hypothetical protein
MILSALPVPHLTEGQLRILEKFSTIEAELSCLVRETRRTRELIRNDVKKARRNDDHRK